MHRGKVRKPRQRDIGVFLCYSAVGKPHLPRIEGQKGEYTRRNEVGKPRQQRKVRSLGIGATQGMGRVRIFLVSGVHIGLR